jgi:signal transduction histidine kinase
VRTSGVGRYPPEIESAVYFCCLEALQNAAKHAGPDAGVTIRVSDGDGLLRFAVEDSGAGFDTQLGAGGVGLANMLARMAAVGGTLHVVSAPGHGTSVSGRVDLPAESSS